jgi:FHS family L-fucose permease-like MFS transporter
VTPSSIAASQTDASVGGARNGRLIPLAMALFFAFGFCTVLVDTLTPKLKGMFSLSYAEVMLTPFAFFGAYALVGLPASGLLKRLGYLETLATGLVITAFGCLLFTPAASVGEYPLFLLAVFVMASGVTVVQVAANPLTTVIGDPRYSHSRLTLAQAFNSLATMVGPMVGSALILAHSHAAPDPHKVSAAVLTAFRRTEAHSVQGPFMAIAGGLALLALTCLAFRKQAPRPVAASGGSYAKALRSKKLMFGALAIFTYVGAEVTIGSLMTNYLMTPRVLGTTAQVAGSLVSVYWGLAMVGRFVGAFALRRIKAGNLLAFCGIVAGLLTLGSALGAGLPAAVMILSVGLFNSIMFPTVFAMAVEDLGEAVGAGSGILCVAIVGGAVVPLVTGWAADLAGLSTGLLIPAACYVCVLGYGLVVGRLGFGRKAQVETLGEALDGAV